jgi:hypothetical protein
MISIRYVNICDRIANLSLSICIGRHKEKGCSSIQGRDR